MPEHWATPSWRKGKVALLAPVGTQLLYLAVHLVEGTADPGLQPRPTVVGEVAREAPRLLEEYARVLQLRQLRFGHLPVGAPFPSFGHPTILLGPKLLRTGAFYGVLRSPDAGGGLAFVVSIYYTTSGP
jgi:hypothetical protein